MLNSSDIIQNHIHTVIQMRNKFGVFRVFWSVLSCISGGDNKRKETKQQPGRWQPSRPSVQLPISAKGQHLTEG